MKDKQDIINNPSQFDEVKIKWESTASQDLNSPLVQPEELDVIKQFYNDNTDLKNKEQDPFNYDPSEPWIQTYTGLRFTPLNPNPDTIVIQDIAHALAMTCRFSGHIKKFYCVTPDTKVLTADLTWKPAGELKNFEQLIGFDENTGVDGLKKNNRESRRKLDNSYVLHTGIIKRHVFALHLSDGTILKSSAEHPWLICSKKSRNQFWETTEGIVKAVKSGKQRFMLKFIDVWKEDPLNYELAYLEGIFDGEATISAKKKGFVISIAQNEGEILNKIKKLLDNNKVPNSQYKTNKNCKNITLTGKWFTKLQSLGKIKSKRLINNFKNSLKNGDWRKEFDSINMSEILKIEDLGVQEVVALETSSKTYFAEGYGAHNSVAQHSVLVSHLCDSAHALHGLLHDASEAYLIDLPSPLKRSGKFNIFKEYENSLQETIYKKFGLSQNEPQSVKFADTKMLYTEARDLFKTLRSDWEIKKEAYPFIIDPLPPQQAKDLFMKRFYELTGTPETYYNHYLKYEYNDINNR